MKKQWEGLLEEKSFVRYTIYMYEVKKNYTSGTMTPPPLTVLSIRKKKPSQNIC